MSANTLEVRANHGTGLILEGKVPVARLLQIAGVFLVRPYMDTILHLKLDELQVRGAWESDSDMLWQGYDYVNQAWVTVELKPVQS